MSEVIELAPEAVEETLQDQVNLMQGLFSCQDLPGLKFAQILSENIEKISEVASPLDDLVKPTPELEKFVEEMHAFAGQDPEKRKEFELLHPEIVNARNAQLDVVNNLLAQPCELKLKKFPKAILPPQMTARQYMAIKSIIY